MKSPSQTLPYVVGVDVGTTLTKAVVYAADGTPLRRAARPTVVDRDGPGRYEQDVRTVFRSVCEVLAELDPGPAIAVGVTGQGDGLWLVDRDGEPIRPAISWLDGRAADIVAEWEAAGLLETLFERTGSLPYAGNTGPLLAWLDRYEPGSLDKAATAARCKDVVVQQLTGLRATDVSDASVPFLDPRTRDYDAGLITAAGLAHRRDLLPSVQSAPTGHLRTSVGSLPSGTPVVAAPYDLPATAWGADVDELGDGLLIVGTTLACQVMTDRIGVGEPAGFTLSTWQPGRWLRAMPAMVGTATIDWILDLVGARIEDLPSLLVQGRSEGLSVLPFFAEGGERAPFVAPTARARIDGLHTGVGRADIVRATCEAIAFSARHCLSAAGLTGELTACGGGMRTTAWAQIFADVLGRPIRILTGDEAGARGAAQAALQAIGVPPMPTAARPTVVEPARADAYEDRYAAYLDTVTHARTTWRTSP
ncbi:MAG: carbohydrate kinase [Hamadaea sp.]|uniref:FGGY-family carbohydrate kinase n=1 Tax=Hamadaea sp. TaxID=2024425 RepID=UPI00180A3EB7|nr:FGGY-family carbohydrate kinase [Hamadaea sp.]NUR47923.1 carbohydrate kinase [Hamadaea sp.]NUT18927.1 carbohydrate kinase [Hamadaea sp.]